MPLFKAGRLFAFKKELQQAYERLGDRVERLLYRLMTSPPFSLQCVPLHEDHPQEDDSFIFHSSNWQEADKAVVIIHGTGVVRAC